MSSLRRESCQNWHSRFTFSLEYYGIKGFTPKFPWRLKGRIKNNICKHKTTWDTAITWPRHMGIENVGKDHLMMASISYQWILRWSLTKRVVNLIVARQVLVFCSHTTGSPNQWVHRGPESPWGAVIHQQFYMESPVKPNSLPVWRLRAAPVIKWRHPSNLQDVWRDATSKCYCFLWWVTSWFIPARCCPLSIGPFDCVPMFTSSWRVSLFKLFL
jgi:hypothetical protein